MIGVSRKLTVIIGVATMIMGAVLQSIITWDNKPPPNIGRKPLRQFDINPIREPATSPSNFWSLAISTDGQRIYYSVPNGSSNEVHLHDLGTGLEQPLEGVIVEGQSKFGLSQNDKWLYFWNAESKLLQKISTTGGKPISVGASYERKKNQPINFIALGPDGQMALTDANTHKGLSRLTSGGDLEVLTQEEPGTDHSSPWFSRTDNKLLFGIYDQVGPTEMAETSRMAILQLDTGDVRVLGRQGGLAPTLTPSGHLLFVQGNSLWASLFDHERDEMVGDVVLVRDDLFPPLFAPYSVSQEGTLVHYRSAAEQKLYRLVLVNHQGKEADLGAPPRVYGNPSMSPDGQRVAVPIGEMWSSDIWVYRLKDTSLMRLTFEQAHFMQPTWTDADLITFDFGPTNLTSLDPSSKQANGMGDLLQLTKGSSWRLSMRGPVLMQCDQGIANCDIARLPGTTNGQVELILNDAHNEMMPYISPDGRWLAYLSDESGRSELYVRPYPDLNQGKWQVSVEGAGAPRWSPDGSALYFINAKQEMMVAAIDTEGGFNVTTRVTLFDVSNYHFPMFFTTVFNMTPDGQQFLMVKPAAEQAGVQIQVVMNFFDELERLLPNSK